MQENTTTIASPPWQTAGDHVATDDRELMERWLARELHDLVVQPLTSSLVELSRTGERDSAVSSQRADAIARELRTALHGVRHLMSELRGQSIDSEGLVPSVLTLVADVRHRTGIDANLKVAPGWPANLAPETTRNLRRIIEEAVCNVTRHSGASWLEIELEDLTGGLRVSITDDGALGPQASDEGLGGMGTQGMRERAVVIGGVLTIDHAHSGSTVAVVVGEQASEQVER